MRVSALLPTHHLFEESIPWLVEARSVFDELVIFVDEERATPGTITRARELATRVHCHKAETWFASNFAAMAQACESEWIFLIEYDEQLSPEWRQKDQWRKILETTPFTHFWFPRRWILPGGDRYIKCDPWFPDFQLRLLRNNLEGTKFATKLHDTLRVSGSSAYFQNLSIHHHVLSLLSRSAREEKVRYYEQLRPGGGLGYLYLYEDYRPPEAPLPTPVQLDVNAELVWMDKLLLAHIWKISCRITGVPPKVPKGKLFWIDADVDNATSQPLYPFPPFPVRLSYHWVKKATRRLSVFEGHRSGLFPCVRANENMHCRMAIIAPDRAGEYILQTSIVQDNVCWFDEVRPDIMREFFVTVH